MVKFKNENTVLQVAGIGRVDHNNITPELYERLIALSDSHKELFEVTNEDVKPNQSEDDEH